LCALTAKRLFLLTYDAFEKSLQATDALYVFIFMCIMHMSESQDKLMNNTLWRDQTVRFFLTSQSY
jgi:hypothetical protein